MNKKRFWYMIATILLIAVEVCIALFVHDDWIRPYFGDVLVVIVLYTFVRSIIPEKCKGLVLYIFIFACAVECLQGVGLVDLLGLGDSTFFRVLMGSVFDIKDIVCYGIGCLLLGVYEVSLHMMKHKPRD